MTITVPVRTVIRGVNLSRKRALRVYKNLSAIRVYKSMQHMTDKAGPEEDWTTRGIEFGETMGELLRILEAVETGVEADDFPRAMYQASIEKTGQRETRRQEVRQEEAREQMGRGHGNPREGNGQGEDAIGQRQA